MTACLGSLRHRVRFQPHSCGFDCRQDAQRCHNRRAEPLVCPRPLLPGRSTRHGPRPRRRGSPVCPVRERPKAAEQKKPAAARLIDIGPHVQRGDNLIAIAVGAVPAERRRQACGPPRPRRKRPPVHAGADPPSSRRERAALKPPPCRGAPGACRRLPGWLGASGVRRRGMDARVRTDRKAAARRPRARRLPAPLATAGRIGRTRAALTVADPLTTALGRPSREQVVTSRSTPADDAAGAGVVERRHAGGVHRARGRGAD